MTARARLALLTAVATAFPALALAGPAGAATPVLDGSSPERAAASCWEVKKNVPDAGDGVYWLLTPGLQAPTKFFCDQTTDGGGWVMVARGRQGWVEGGDGRGTPASLTGTPDGPDAFLAKQLPGTTIDALLGGGRVDALTDGIRLKRALTSDGSRSQEVRVKLAGRDRWSWALSASPGIAVSSYSVDGVTSTAAQTTRTLDISTDTQHLSTALTSTNGFVRGFTYGRGGPVGSTSSTDHLYSTLADGSYATPFTQVFLRPKLQVLSFARVPDSGTTARSAPAIPESGALPSPWGVTGLGAGGDLYYATEVSAFAQVGGRVFVGGNFTQVRKADGSQVVDQPYLAAFDATTGAWIPGFRPRFNNQVKALAALPDGRLAVGGEFSTLDGKPAVGLTVLSSATGARDTSFKAAIKQTTSGAKRWVRTLDVRGTALYVGGGFTHYRGGSSTKDLAFRNIVRVSTTDGAPSTTWRPNLGSGIVQPNGKRSLSSSVLSLDVSDDGRTVYAAGQFQQGYVGADGKASVSRPGAAVISTAAPAKFTAWPVVWSTAKKLYRYQQAVRQVGSRVWLGGSQHSFFGYSASTLKLTSGNITFGGGDTQAITSREGVVYASCHCNEWSYAGTTQYDAPKAQGYTQVDRIGYVGAFDATTGDHYPQFAPTTTTRKGEGPWALLSADDGTLWSGGDYVAAVDRDGTNQWAGGFVRFAMRPHTPPAPPADAAVTVSGTTAYVSWTASATPGVTYEILRNDRVVDVSVAGSTSISVTGSAVGDRFFVRATDGRGNRSASTAVVTAS